jgi:multiple sugar transport system substrate-binding protein
MMRRGWRARFAWGAAALVLLGLACTPQRAAKPQNLEFWVYSPVAAVQPLVDRFETANPGIHVVLDQLDEQAGNDRIANAVFNANEPPDLCELPSRDVSHFMVRGALSDWSAGVADLRAGIRGWEMCMVGDAIYGLPWRLDTRALFYNKVLLASARLDSTNGPGTWAELRTAAARIQRLPGGAHGYGLPAPDPSAVFEQFMPYGWSRGGEILSDGLDSSRFDSPANRAALELLVELRPVSLLAQPESLDREFVAGHLGFRLAGPALCARIASAAPGLHYGVALVPQPDRGKGTHASLARGRVLASFTTSRHKEDALKLARFLAEPEQALALARARPDMLPVNLGVDTTADYRDRPAQRMLFRQLENARFTPGHRDWPSLEAILSTYVGDALAGRHTVAEAMLAADTSIVRNLGPR